MRSHVLPLKRSSNGDEMSPHIHRALSRSLLRNHSGSNVSSLRKKKTCAEVTMSNICGEDVRPQLASESLAVSTHNGGVRFLKPHISEEVLKHVCTGRQRADELVAQTLGLMAYLGVALDEWNTEFVKVKYLQDEYERKMSVKAKEVATLEDQLTGCRTELANMSTSLSLQRQEVERIRAELVEVRAETRQKEKRLKAVAAEKKALELEKKALQYRLSEKELIISEAEANEISLKAVQDFKNSLTYRDTIEDHVQEARNHILDVEVKDLEHQCLEEGFIRGFLKGIRFVHRKTGASIEDLSPNQVSEDPSPDLGDEGVESEFKGESSSDENDVLISCSVT